MSESKRVVTLTVRVDSNDIPGTVQVYSAQVTRGVNKLPTAKVALRDGDAAQQTFALSSEDLFKPGKELEIQVGYESTEVSIFKGVITSQSIRISKIGDVLTVEAKDPAFRMTVGLHNRFYYEATDSDAMEEIIREYGGLTGDVEATDVTHPALVEYQSTDWDFLVNRAEVNGKLVYVKDGTVKVAEPGLSQGAVETYQYGESIFDAEMRLDGRFQYPAVAGKTWSAADQAVVETEGSAPSMNAQGNLDSDALGGDLEIPDITQTHAGQAQEAEMKGYNSAAMLKSRLGRIRGYVTVQGSEKLDPDVVITLEGLGDRFNGDAYVTAIRHDISGGNWQTQVQFGLEPEWFVNQINGPSLRTASGLLPAIGGLHIGVVTQLEGDPEGEDRILVALPLIDPDQDGLWSRLALLDAGDTRGTMFRPEIGDEVIVGFLNEDPRHSVVLGMLHSSAKPSPSPATDDNHEKGIWTRDELKVWFNDDLKIIEISTPGGNVVNLTEDQGGIFMEDENGNKLTLDSNGITLESAKDIVLKAPQGDVSIEGINIDLAAQAQLKAEGGAGAELSTSAVAVVKGSLVQIN